MLWLDWPVGDRGIGKEGCCCIVIVCGVGK